ncbi:MAG: LysR substrate-binding domain-containing protein [Carboxylicivirga sp.]|jgi:DNA-binding transcriptional LysR family regulator|nr:LysR substrate-binding domain-containing protein [Carboxylicivirga sp.]
MDFRDTVFLSVAENLSFSKAALDLFISQPAVTKHIKELENKYKVDLFERQGNKIHLTEAGKLSYHKLKAIQQEYRELEFELGSLGDKHKGELRIGASSTISQYILPDILAHFHKRYSLIQLHLFNGNSFEMEQKLLNKDIDIALVENSSSQSNIRYQTFLNDEIIAVTGTNSHFKKRNSFELSELAKLPLVLREKGSGTLDFIYNVFGTNHVNIDQLNITIHLGSTEAIKRFVKSYDGVALVSQKAVEKELLQKELVKLNVRNLEMVRPLRLAYRFGHVSDAGQLFSDFVSHYNH